MRFRMGSGLRSDMAGAALEPFDQACVGQAPDPWWRCWGVPIPPRIVLRRVGGTKPLRLAEPGGPGRFWSGWGPAGSWEGTGSWVHGNPPPPPRRVCPSLSRPSPSHKILPNPMTTLPAHPSPSHASLPVAHFLIAQGAGAVLGPAAAFLMHFTEVCNPWVIIQHTPGGGGVGTTPQSEPSSERPSPGPCLAPTSSN